MKEYINELKKLTRKAIKKKEIPVACLILKDECIIAKAYNKKEKKNDPMMHAEIIAIKKACKKLKTWRLNECEMIVTLRPCKMCEEIIKESRIKKVVYILESKVTKKEVTTYEKCDTDKQYFEELLTMFFKEKR